ncbi:cytochrome P450 [Obba rivulosa]|uniref:Cytochrome P450 n=1 Tax=Obba rivulosa TaxID=1052685 RepID=A0A8E2B340_9APHY|nr:cytochrome P450 [Obba rivulosa]
MPFAGLIVLALFALCVTHLWSSKLSSKAKRYPPGPFRHPLVGHSLQVPTIKTWRYFERLAHTYGSIFRLSLAGDNVIILSDPGDAEELVSSSNYFRIYYSNNIYLGRRSRNYSSRPPLVYAGKYQSNNKRMVLLPYGETLKKQRAAFHQMLQPRMVGGYETIQELESLKLLHDMLTRPSDAGRHCQRYSASLAFYLAYGKRLGDDGADLDGVLNVLSNFTKDTYPGTHMVDTFPILDILPDFLLPRLVLEVKQRMDSGEMNLECFDLEDLSYVAGTAFEAGTDSAAATVQWFLIAMRLFPDTTKQAQAELDTVLGADAKTIPSFAHMPELRYCAALVKEVFRWRPAAPVDFPHYSEIEDEYKGFTIDAKTMHHDKTRYPSPAEFDPERFLKRHYSFGFGRRKCPGQYMATKSIWLAITRLMWHLKLYLLPTRRAGPFQLIPTAAHPE